MHLEHISPPSIQALHLITTPHRRSSSPEYSPPCVNTHTHIHVLTTSLLRIFCIRYTRRCSERHNQEPIEYVTSELKKAAKAEASWSQLLLTPDVGSLVGPFEASRLDPLLDAVLGTGYKALTQIFVWNIPLRNTDILVLARYVVCASSVIFGAREFCVAYTFTSHSLFAPSRVSQKDQCLSLANLIARQSY